MSRAKPRFTLPLIPPVAALAALALLIVAAHLARPAAAETDEPVSLFNGSDLDGWVGDERFWRVEDGAIVGQSTDDNRPDDSTFLIWEGGEPGDFKLTFRYRITSDWANSGVQIRSAWDRDNGYTVAGYQPDIATDDGVTGIHYEKNGRGVLARRGQKVEFGNNGSKQVTRFADENQLAEKFDNHAWTEYRVVARGNRIVTKINGHRMHEVVDDAPQARRDGVIAFQLHPRQPMTIHFKDITLQPLDSD